MRPFHPVAIVGIGGIFPNAPTLEAFWELIVSGRDASREPPAGRWLFPVDEVFDTSVAAADKVSSRRGCFIRGFTLDRSGLDLESAFLDELDPMFHLALHAGRQALWSADLRGTDPGRIGVVFGNIALPTDSSSLLAEELVGRTFEEKAGSRGGRSETGPTAASINRYVAGLPAGVLARALGLGGGTYTLDAACASSLYALDLACAELAAGRTDAMLAGGLSRPDCLYTQMGFSQLRALSPTGTCAPFDARGNGLVVGEGSGIFVLKRLEDAFRDGDRIHGVIRGIGLSNDVEGSLLAPSSEGQLRAMRRAYERAGWSPQDVDLIECHATGTPLGDAVEFRSCLALWDKAPWEKGQCVIGSVKSNVGHLLTGAGAAGVAKVLLAFNHKALPPTANFSHSGPDIDLANSPFRVLRRRENWKNRRGRLPRRAAVSAFGFGGINAHVLIEEWDPAIARRSVRTARVPAQSGGVPVAVVGMAAHFGRWSTLRSFQERVLGGGTDHPKTPPRWFGAGESGWFAESGLDEERFRGHYIAEMEILTDRFRIPPNELRSMLPQQLLMLKVADAALADASWSRQTGLDCGVYIGTGLDLNTTNYHLRWAIKSRPARWADELGLAGKEGREWADRLADAAATPLSADRTMGALGGIVASRVAREFRIGGPSFTVQNEECSGLRAVERALRALQSGELNGAVVGAVDLAGDIRSMLAAHRDRPYSSSGRGPFHPDADGTLPGEGAAAVILKRLDDAVRDGDRIYAVIRGVGVASGGGADRGVPESRTYGRAMSRAYHDAGVEPATVGYLEAHGSGIPAEDHMEADALTGFFTASEGSPCVLGSAKSDIGHTGAASGLASFIKAALCLYQEVLPPLRGHGESPSAGLFQTPDRSRYWLRDRKFGPRRAGVSSMSVDGNCAHVVLEAWEEMRADPGDRLQPLGSRREALFTVAADEVPALVKGLADLRQRAGDWQGRDIERLARRWFREAGPGDRGRRAVALVARDTDELQALALRAGHELDRHPDRDLSESGSRVSYQARPVGAEGETAFVFPGSGNLFPGMGRELAVQWPEVLRRQDGESEFLKSQYLPDIFWADGAGGEPDARSLIFGQVTAGIMVSDLLRSFSVIPRAVIGYSLGESVGLLALRAWPDRDEMLRRMKASTLFTRDLAGRCEAARAAWGIGRDKKVDWLAAVIKAPADVVRRNLKPGGRAYLLIINTPRECVIGGDRRAVESLARDLGAELLPLRGVTTVHCEVAEGVSGPYRDLHLFTTTAPKDVRFYSASGGGAYAVDRRTAADSILRQALEGFDFTKVVESAYRDGVRVFVEPGPGASCTRMIREILGERPHAALPASTLESHGVSGFLRLLGQLVSARVPLNLKPLYGTPPVAAAHREEERVSPERMIRLPVGGEPFQLPRPHRPAEPPAPPPVAAEKVSPLAEVMSLTAPSAGSGLVQPPATLNAPEKVRADGVRLLVEGMRRSAEARSRAHETFLRFSSGLSDLYSRTLSRQIELTGKAPLRAGGPAAPSAAVRDTTLTTPSGDNGTPSRPARGEGAPFLDRARCLEYARGKIAHVLGPAFAAVDGFPTRVRLPDEPLMLVDRILEVAGEERSLTSGRVVTEHDIHRGVWYLDGGRIPTCIAVEAGQADLFLSGYLGIDFVTRGEAVYRLLDAVVTFHRGLPGPEETIRYDIRIDHFFRQGTTRLFRFNFKATVNGSPLLTMTEGCAGFFTGPELNAGTGIVHTDLDRRPSPGRRPADWEELAPMAVESYDEGKLTALREGDLAGCFGPGFGGLDLIAPLRIPGGRMKLIDRVVRLEPEGGRFGLGKILAESDIHPDAWFLTCHFVDDRVMPGTLMYECCLHAFRIFLLRLGWVGEQDGVVCEPLPGMASRLKCRGQVLPSTGTAAYEISVKELGYLDDGTPFAVADALMYADGRAIVEMTDMSLRFTGLTRTAILRTWRNGTANRAAATVCLSGPSRKPAIFDSDRILAFAVGKPSAAFGERYRIFDEERVIARLPGPPYQFLDRITAIRAEPWKLETGGEIEAQYDIPPDAWYFAAERLESMPFAVLMETALQPCGWLAAYLGSALTSEDDLSFRNLGGSARQHRPVGPASGTLTTTVKITSISSSGGMIIQSFDFNLRDRRGTVYEGQTHFGFFSKESLADQVGLRDAAPYRPGRTEGARGRSFLYPREAPFPDDRLRMVDRIDLFVADGGPQRLGYLRGRSAVDREAWFFKAHFLQDPVWPGSLGLESFIQLLKVAAADRWGTDSPLTSVVAAGPHQWTYRGQIIPGDREVTVSATVTGVDDEEQTIGADGYLSVDGRVIYGMKDFTLRRRGGGER